ncbi:DUF6441 family protein [Ruegeria arenilitoris]|uniref:DUF6441 family protein n=1 Tax=Ruegeria arenilitoris TaxID=1173585 RepID=UPI00147B64DB|nr:DUF6441 family protein [Ruegeria arenilitoris]
MKFDFGVIEDPETVLLKELRKGERAVTKGVRAAGRGLKTDWRSQIKGAGLGTRLGKTIRQVTFPGHTDSLSAASLVFSRAAKIVDAHDRGALVRSRDGFWLAIPIAEVARMRGPRNKPITPHMWEQRTGKKLRFVYRRGKPGLLVTDGELLDRKQYDPVSWRGSKRKRRSKVTKPIFVLIPQVKLRKRLDLDRAARKWHNQLPELIVANWRN